MKGASVTALEKTLTLDEISKATQGRVAAGGGGVVISTEIAAEGLDVTSQPPA